MEKIKQFVDSETGKDILTVIIVVLVGLGSFELGRLSNIRQSSGIQIEYPKEDSSLNENQQASAIFPENSLQKTPNIISTSDKSQISSGKNFFASRRGSKYYSIGCSAGKSIIQENRVYFITKEDAERAGYELSGSCR